MNIQVKLLNKDELNNNQFLSKFGKFAKICYATSDKVPDHKVGLHCLKSQHFSGSRGIPFQFYIKCDRATSMQLIRHKIGFEVNQRSQRYCNENGFQYIIPPILEKEGNEDLLKDYRDAMQYIDSLYSNIQEQLIERGCNKEQANENARFVLPNATLTELHISVTLEWVVNFLNKRLCLRSQDIIRELAEQMYNEVVEIIPETKELFGKPCDFGKCTELHKCK